MAVPVTFPASSIDENGVSYTFKTGLYINTSDPFFFKTAGRDLQVPRTSRNLYGAKPELMPSPLGTLQGGFSCPAGNSPSGGRTQARSCIFRVCAAAAVSSPVTASPCHPPRRGGPFFVWSEARRAGHSHLDGFESRSDAKKRPTAKAVRRCLRFLFFWDRSFIGMRDSTAKLPRWGNLYGAKPVEPGFGECPPDIRI